MLRLATMQDLTRIMAIVQATVMEMHAYGNYQWDEVYPMYGFEKHKGYGTAAHIQAIKEYGLCPIHRKSFTKNF